MGSDKRGVIRKTSADEGESVMSTADNSPFNTVRRFREWLAEQPYWVNMTTVRDEFPDMEFDLIGATTKRNDDGETLIPKRDLRKGIRVAENQ